MLTRTAEEQFLKAYDELADPVFRHCYFRVSDREKAKDLMQEAFTKTWIHICNGGKIENIRAFVYKVANNLIIDHYRKKKDDSLDTLQADGFDPGFDDREKLFSSLDAKEALAAIQKLDELYREAVMMRYIDELSPKEIAGVLGVTENVVSVRIHRGLKKLKETLEK